MNTLRLLLLALALALAGCGDTGTRHKSDGLQVGQFSVTAWPGVTELERAWIEETVTAHVQLLGAHVGPGPACEIVFVERAVDLVPIRNAIAYAQGSGQGPVPIFSQLQAGGAGEALIDVGAKQIIYIFAGDRIEGLELGHAMMHTVIGDLPRTAIRNGAVGATVAAINRGGHLDPRWKAFLLDDWILSLQIRSRR